MPENDSEYANRVKVLEERLEKLISLLKLKTNPNKLIIQLL